MPETFTLRHRCTDQDMRASDLEDMYEADREITYRTFRKHCSDLPEVAQSLGYAVGSERGLRLVNDGHVRFFRSRYKGRLCYHMDWSAIDHIWLQERQA